MGISAFSLLLCFVWLCYSVKPYSLIWIPLKINEMRFDWSLMFLKTMVDILWILPAVCKFMSTTIHVWDMLSIQRDSGVVDFDAGVIWEVFMDTLFNCKTRLWLESTVVAVSPTWLLLPFSMMEGTANFSKPPFKPTQCLINRIQVVGLVFSLSPKDTNSVQWAASVLLFFILNQYTERWVKCQCSKKYCPNTKNDSPHHRQLSSLQHKEIICQPMTAASPKYC